MKDFGRLNQRPDGSFVITLNGLPFHVPNEGEFAELFAEVSAYALANPGRVTMEQPEDLAAQRPAEISNALAEIDRLSVRPLRAIAKGPATPDDLDRLAGLEARARALRAELAELEGEPHASDH